MQFPRRSLASRATTLLVLLSYVSSTAKAASCPDPISPNTKCVSVNSFAQFVREVESTPNGQTKCFENFSVTKGGEDLPAKILNKRVTIACRNAGMCQVRGGGIHVRVLGNSAETTLSGFEFVGASVNAVQLNAGGRRGYEQTLCDCSFEDNTSKKKGAAVKVFDSTKARIENCYFYDNYSRASGGAVMVSGGELTLVSSTFRGNEAKIGGAVIVEDSNGAKAKLAMSACTFINNIAQGRGPALCVGNEGMFIDGGSSSFSGNEVPKGANTVGTASDCNGIYFPNRNKCEVFAVVAGSFQPPPTKAPTRPPPTKVPTRPPPTKAPTRPPPTNAVPQPTNAPPPPIKPPVPQPTNNPPTRAPPTDAPPTNAPPTDAPQAIPRPTVQQTPQVTFKSNPVPRNAPNNYFNYALNDANYGPIKGWPKLRAKNTDEYSYWKEWDQYLKPDLTKNYCGRNGKRESPIDLNMKAVNDKCLEYHEIRERPGQYSLSDPKVQVLIQPTHLRIKWPKFTQWNNGDEWWLKIRGPNADIPKAWGHHFPVTHADFVMPSAHTVNGKRYVAEYQVWIMTNRGRGTPAISILVDIDENERDNWYFQAAIDAWQQEFDENQAACANGRRGLRRTTSSGNRTLFAPEPPESYYESEEFREHDDLEEDSASRRLQQGVWNPWHSMMVKSIWFWGYEGSTLSPPCYPFVEWRVLDVPMTISTRQLNQLQKILFTNVNPKTCNPTSVHADGVSSRPPVKNVGQSLHKCNCYDFFSDRYRKQNPRIRDCGDLKKEDRPPLQ